MGVISSLPWKPIKGHSRAHVFSKYDINACVFMYIKLLWNFALCYYVTAGNVRSCDSFDLDIT